MLFLGLLSAPSLASQGADPGCGVRTAVYGEDPDTLLLGLDPKIIALRDQIRRIAPHKISVWIKGETGTGKEVVAREIHRLSARNEKPFLALNMAAIAESLMESELFGHSKGSFTGADKRRLGKFEEADGGTIFLDEMTEMPFVHQAKLLRVLQNGEVQMVGSNETKLVDVRVISAANVSPAEAVAGRKLREDIYFRLAVVELYLPPLRKRKWDIVLLADHFLHRECAKNNKPTKSLAPEVKALFLRYPWPGNVRELEATIEVATIFSDKPTIELEHLPHRMLEESKWDALLPAVPQGEGKFPTLDELDVKYIEQILIYTDNNMSEAAKILGMDRATLTRRMKKLKMEIPSQSN